MPLQSLRDFAFANFIGGLDGGLNAHALNPGPIPPVIDIVDIYQQIV